MASIGFFEIFLAAICFLILCCLSEKNGLPRNCPLVGMLPNLFLHLHRIHDKSTETLHRSGCNFLCKGPWFTNMDTLMTSDPTNVHYIMSTNFTNFPKGSEYKKIFDVFGDGIFSSDGDLWMTQRKVARALINNRGFYQFTVKTSRNKVERGLIPVLEHVSKQTLVVDFQDLFQRFTFDVTCMLVTGYDPRCLSIEFPEDAFSKALDDAAEAIFYRHVMPENLLKLQRWLGIGQEKKMTEAWATLDHVIANYISRRREELSGGTIVRDNEEGVDLLKSYMNEENTMGLKSNDKFLRDTIMNFMLAGRDTTSTALTWFFWLLSKNPVVETKIREELKATIPSQEGESWRLFDIEELNKLVYLHGALCEALRLYPPIPFEHKAPVRPDILPSGHHVHPKMKILLSSYAMGRMSSIWGQDCLEFKPERWISEQGVIKHEPSYKFFAFNAGPRTCIGKEVAFPQMKVIAAAIIHNYHVQVLEGHSVAVSASIILRMKHGLMVRVTKRWA